MTESLATLFVRRVLRLPDGADDRFGTSLLVAVESALRCASEQGWYEAADAIAELHASRVSADASAVAYAAIARRASSFSSSVNKRYVFLSRDAIADSSNVLCPTVLNYNF